MDFGITETEYQYSIAQSRTGQEHVRKFHAPVHSAQKWRHEVLDRCKSTINTNRFSDTFNYGKLSIVHYTCLKQIKKAENFRFYYISQWSEIDDHCSGFDEK